MTTPHVATKRRASPVRRVPMAGLATQTGVDAAAIPAPQVPRERAIDADARWAMIAEAAYYRAAGRGFAPGGELQDWLDAEAQIREGMGA